MLYESINIPLWRNLRNISGWHILDIGCGTGGIGELLEKSGNCVDGITHSEEEAAIASTRIHRVLLMDLNDYSAIKRTIEKKSYDALLLASVLEHLVDPLASLKALEHGLAKAKKVYISLPNIACFYVRFSLLLGRFDMQSEGGILDETHLHHYTLKTAREMIEKAGLEIQEIDFMPAFSVWLYQNFVKREESKPPKKMIDRREFRFYERRIYPVERFLTSFWPRMFANEFLFICCPKPR